MRAGKIIQFKKETTKLPKVRRKTLKTVQWKVYFQSPASKFEHYCSFNCKTTTKHSGYDKKTRPALK